MSHHRPLSEEHLPTPPTLSKISTTLSQTPHPFHAITQRLARFLDPFNPHEDSLHPSISNFNNFDTPTTHDAIMYHNYRSRYLEKGQRATRKPPSMERMQVPVLVSSSSRSASASTFTSPFPSRRPSSITMSTPEMEGSEFLEPTLAESTYARHATSSYTQAPGTAKTKTKPWSYAQYVGLQRGQIEAGKTRTVNEQPGAHASPTYSPQYMENSGAYKAPLTAEEQVQRERFAREWRAREEREKRETDEDNALMDSFEFEPTIRPYVPKFQYSFAGRKGFSSSGTSSGGRM
ncbi:hypothetical protein SBOR_6547 [Sclerotinia borealis F-4128]|uniref:Uncharacterized protein n=1 Tax=Sclerotinia borealis (strain F-4128) TaxID=1432307 RepID=W9C8J1_SCLBF|nr:hypothetical protein SBOR_6547 [Sclerotinia borealis F-4128]